MIDDAPASVLVVDDTPANLEILTHMLKGLGHRPRPVPTGAMALRAAEHETPDLVLMDINMPEMDGFETCQRLKAEARTREVPVLFISARSDTYDKIQAFQSGGVDYITKPFDLDEVTARIKTHLELSRLQKALSRQYKELKQLEEMRDNLVHMVVHDMRSPLSVIKMALAMLSENAEVLDEESQLDLEAASNCSQKLMVMVNNLLDLSRLESGNMPLKLAETRVCALVDDAVASLRTFAAEHNLVVEHRCGDEATVTCDAGLVQRVVVNLASNAIKFTPEGRSIKVSTETLADGSCWICVDDEGPGIAPEYHAHVFEKFGQCSETEQKQPSTGLGLTFCRLAIEAHGGEMGLDSTPGEGSSFWFSLPGNQQHIESEVH
ncbi:MAG: response regulator [Pseudomonadota bacterium]